ncbi:MAG: MBL fold metallo-hydrolase [archaeon]
MEVHQLAVGPMQNFSYLVASGKECLLIDPGWDHERIKSVIQEDGLVLKYVILTHSHYDHVQELSHFLAYQDVSIVAWRDSPLNPSVSVGEDTVLPLGDTEVRFIHTPGHVPDQICVLVDGNLFTGDTLFVSRIGRTDLPGGDSAQMEESLDKLRKLPPETIVWPGHDYGPKKHSTIGDEIKENPYLRF